MLDGNLAVRAVDRAHHLERRRLGHAGGRHAAGAASRAAHGAGKSAQWARAQYEDAAETTEETSERGNEVGDRCSRWPYQKPRRKLPSQEEEPAWQVPENCAQSRAEAEATDARMRPARRMSAARKWGWEENLCVQCIQDRQPCGILARIYLGRWTCFGCGAGWRRGPGLCVASGGEGGVYVFRFPFSSHHMNNNTAPCGVKREQDETGTAAATTAGTTTTTTASTGDGMWGGGGGRCDAR